MCACRFREYHKKKKKQKNKNFNQQSKFSGLCLFLMGEINL